MKWNQLKWTDRETERRNWNRVNIFFCVEFSQRTSSLNFCERLMLCHVSWCLSQIQILICPTRQTHTHIGFTTQTHQSVWISNFLLRLFWTMGETTNNRDTYQNISHISFILCTMWLLLFSFIYLLLCSVLLFLLFFHFVLFCFILHIALLDRAE